MDLLTELVLDSGFWLELKGLTPEEKQRLYEREKITPAEQYWYDFLFPQWFNEPDPQLPRWKQEMMAGNFNQNDADLISSLSNEIEQLGGSCIWRYILDLSMATDLAVVAHLGIPLCVQLTITSGKWLTDKKPDWEDLLRYWGIKRGLLVSLDPRNLNSGSLAGVILQKGDTLPSVCYSEHIA